MKQTVISVRVAMQVLNEGELVPREASEYVRVEHLPEVLVERLLESVLPELHREAL